MRLILCRHGQTDDNINHVLSGRSEVQLNSLGRAQVRRTADYLQDELIKHAYVSPLARTRETAEYLLEKRSSVKPLFEDAIIERAFGVLERAYEADYRLIRAKAAPREEWLDWAPQGGESLREMYRRIFAFNSLLASRHPNDTVLVVTHGDPCGAFVTLYGHEPLTYDLHSANEPQNAALSIIEVGGREIEFKLRNSIEHLADLAKR